MPLLPPLSKARSGDACAERHEVWITTMNRLSPE